MEVEFENYYTGSTFVAAAEELLSIDKVVRDASIFDEAGLVLTDKITDVVL